MAPFTSSDLTQEELEFAESVCSINPGSANADIYEACLLDVGVSGDPTLAELFTYIESPAMVVELVPDLVEGLTLDTAEPMTLVDGTDGEDRVDWYSGGFTIVNADGTQRYWFRDINGNSTINSSTQSVLRGYNIRRNEYFQVTIDFSTINQEQYSGVEIISASNDGRYLVLGLFSGIEPDYYWYDRSSNNLRLIEISGEQRFSGFKCCRAMGIELSGEGESIVLMGADGIERRNMTDLSSTFYFGQVPVRWPSNGDPTDLIELVDISGDGRYVLYRVEYNIPFTSVSGYLLDTLTNEVIELGDGFFSGIEKGAKFSSARGLMVYATDNNLYLYDISSKTERVLKELNGFNSSLDGFHMSETGDYAVVSEGALAGESEGNNSEIFDLITIINTDSGTSAELTSEATNLGRGVHVTISEDEQTLFLMERNIDGDSSVYEIDNPLK